MGYGNSRSVRFQDGIRSSELHSLNGSCEIKLKDKIDKTWTAESHNTKPEEVLRKTGKSLKAEMRYRVFSEEFEKAGREILDPRGHTIRRWNKIFLLACLFSLSLDPLFFYLPVVRDEVCIDIALHLKVILTTLRSLADVFYMAHIYNSTSQDSLIFPLSSRIVKATGLMTETAWAGAAYNLMLYMLASHVLGACWYLLSIERQEACWRSVCNIENSYPYCQYGFFDCAMVADPGRSSWFRSSNISYQCSPDGGFYQFGIYADALISSVTTSPFFNKYFYCLWWGLRSLRAPELLWWGKKRRNIFINKLIIPSPYVGCSSLGQNLSTSTYFGEIIFAIIIATLGLVLFGLLIGNMQTYLQSITIRFEEWRIKKTDTEQWMHHRQLPPELKLSVLKYNQYKWVATRGVDEEALLKGLPADLRRDIRRHLCLDLVRRVPLFDQMEESMLDAICERLKPALRTKGTFLVREGDPVNEMVFIFRGHLVSYTTGGGRTGFFNSCRLGPGDFCGEELVTWALDARSSSILPSSTRTIRAITEVEAFAIVEEDLKFVASQFRSKQLRHKFRFYSHQWRTWAAYFIQIAWRRYRKRKDAAELKTRESHAADEPEPPEPESDLGVYEERLRVTSKWGVLKHSISSAGFVSPLQKPAEPDFAVDEE